MKNLAVSNFFCCLLILFQVSLGNSNQFRHSNESISFSSRSTCPISTNWENSTPLPIALAGSALVNDDQGNLFLFGGLDSNFRFSLSAFKLTKSTNQWSAIQNIPFGLIVANGVFIDGKIYILVGNDAKLLVYNIATNTYQSFDNKDTNGIHSAKMLVYNIAANSYETFDNKDTNGNTIPSRFYYQVVADDSTIYWIGGSGFSISSISDLYSINVNTDINSGVATWTQLTSMPTPNYSFAAALINGNIYIAGGYGNGNKVQLYNITSNQWTQFGTIPSPIIGWNSMNSVAGSAPNGNTVMWLNSGYICSPLDTCSFSDTTAYFDPSLSSGQQWTFLNAPSQTYVLLRGGTLSSDGYFYLAGGFDLLSYGFITGVQKFYVCTAQDPCANVNCPSGETCISGTCNCGSGSSCPSGETCISDTCNCGSGSSCSSGETCISGTCKCGSGSSCPSGETCISDTCKCGSGSSCPSGEICISGTCKCGSGSSCPSGEICISDICKCGSGSSCPSGEICISDICKCGAGSSCPSGETCINGICNCGSGSSCPSGETCISGTCNCGSGSSCPSGETCISDTCKCGSGSTCPSGEICISDICNCGSDPSCQQGSLCCNGQCKTLTEVNTCGSCSNDCSSLGLCCSGTCADIKSDQTCGSCNVQCSNGQLCSPNTLTCVEPSKLCGSSIVFPTTSVNEGSQAVFTFNINPLLAQTSQRFTITLTGVLNGQTLTNSVTFGGSSTRQLALRFGGPGTASITASITGTSCTTITQTGTIQVVDIPPRVFVNSIQPIKVGQSIKPAGSIQELGFWTRPKLSIIYTGNSTPIQCTISSLSTSATNTQYSFVCPSITFNTAGSFTIQATAQSYWGTQPLLTGTATTSLVVNDNDSRPINVPFPVV